MAWPLDDKDLVSQFAPTYGPDLPAPIVPPGHQPHALAGMGEVKLADAGIDPATPKAKQPAKYSVSEPKDAGLTYRPFESLLPKTPDAIAAAKDAAKAPDGPVDPELAAAQAAGNRSGSMSHLGGILDRAGAIIAGVEPNSAMYAESEKSAGKRATDLLQQRKAAQEKSAELDAKAAKSVDSPESQRATALAVAQGLIPAGTKISLSEWDNIKGGAGIQAQRENAAASLAQTAQQAKDTNAREWANLHFQQQNSKDQRDFLEHMEGLKAQHEYALKMAEEAAKKQAASSKPIPEQEATKLVNMAQAVPIGLALKKQYQLTGPMSPLENQKYDAMTGASESGFAAGAAPNARENAELMKEFRHNMPGAFTKDAAGNLYWDTQLGNIKNNFDHQLETLRAGGYSPEQIDALEKKARALMAAGAPPSGAPATPAPPHPKDSAAVEWAKKNRDNPDAEQILHLNGVQ